MSTRAARLHTTTTTRERERERERARTCTGLTEARLGESTMLGWGDLDLDLDLDSEAAHARMSRAHQNDAQHPAENSNRVIANQSCVRQTMGYFTYSCKREFRSR